MSRSRPSTRSKWASRLNRSAPGSRQLAAIHRSVTEDRRALGELFEAGDRDAMDAAPPHRSINFEAKAAMLPPLLQEIRRYGWPLAPGDAYPTVMLIESSQELKPPCRADLQQLALVAWIEAEHQIARLWQQPSPKRRRFQVEVGSERVPVTIGAVAMQEPLAEPQPAPAAPPRQPAAPPRDGGQAAGAHRSLLRPPPRRQLPRPDPRGGGLPGSQASVAAAHGAGRLPEPPLHSLSIEIQLQAAAKGLILYVPALRAQPRGRA
jgi:hypothetical protein